MLIEITFFIYSKSNNPHNTQQNQLKFLSLKKLNALQHIYNFTYKIQLSNHNSKLVFIFLIMVKTIFTVAQWDLLSLREHIRTLELVN